MHLWRLLIWKGFCLPLHAIFPSRANDLFSTFPSMHPLDFAHSEVSKREPPLHDASQFDSVIQEIIVFYRQNFIDV